MLLTPSPAVIDLSPFLGTSMAHTCTAHEKLDLLHFLHFNHLDPYLAMILSIQTHSLNSIYAIAI